MDTGLVIRLLGPLRVERDGVALPLPQSKKTRALLAYLVTHPREHRRSRLCELFWPDVSDPRGGLRWALSRLRPLLDDEERVRLRADAHTVCLDTADVIIDAREQLRSASSLAPQVLKRIRCGTNCVDASSRLHRLHNQCVRSGQIRLVLLHKARRKQLWIPSLNDRLA
jgi:hypothetical protein